MSSRVKVPYTLEPSSAGEVEGDAWVDRLGYSDLLDLITSAARHELNIQFGALNGKRQVGFALASVDVAGIASVFTARHSLSAFWPLTLFGLVVSALLLALPLLSFKFDTGADLPDFYQGHLGADPIEAKFDMAQAASTCAEKNQKKLNGWSPCLISWGQVALGITAFGSIFWLPR
ncbi:MAG: hypothetical protein ACYDC5_04815 [Candidatus Dormibacteria bacterium]